MDPLPLNVCADVFRLLDVRSLGRLRCALGSKNEELDRILNVKITMIIDHVLYQAASAIVTFFEKWMITHNETSNNVKVFIGRYELYGSLLRWNNSGYTISILNDCWSITSEVTPQLYPIILNILRKELSPETLPFDCEFNIFMKEFQTRWRTILMDHPLIEYRFMCLNNWCVKPLSLRAIEDKLEWIKFASMDEIYSALKWNDNKKRCIQEQLDAAEELTAVITSLYKLKL